MQITTTNSSCSDLNQAIIRMLQFRKWSFLNRYLEGFCYTLLVLISPTSFSLLQSNPITIGRGKTNLGKRLLSWFEFVTFLLVFV
jgi:hypothetical protein